MNFLQNSVEACSRVFLWITIIIFLLFVLVVLVAAISLRTNMKDYVLVETMATGECTIDPKHKNRFTCSLTFSLQDQSYSTVGIFSQVQPAGKKIMMYVNRKNPSTSDTFQDNPNVVSNILFVVIGIAILLLPFPVYRAWKHPGLFCSSHLSKLFSS